jgi:SAM-dependent methyltransferase
MSATWSFSGAFALGALFSLAAAAAAILASASRGRGADGEGSPPPLRGLAWAALSVGALVTLTFLGDVGRAGDGAAASGLRLAPLPGFAAQAPAAPLSCIPACAPVHACNGACASALKLIRTERAASTWKLYYAEIAAALAERGVGANGSATLVEVGTAYGGLTAHLLKALPYLTVMAVDPFIPYDPNDPGLTTILNAVRAEHGEATAVVGSALYARAMSFDQNSAYGCRYHLHHGLSGDIAADAASFPPGCTIDAVFIDGAHTRELVEVDIKAWARIVKPGGLLFFNDYGCGMYPGVDEEVDKHAARTRQQVVRIGDKRHCNALLINLPVREA